MTVGIKKTEVMESKSDKQLNFTGKGNKNFIKLNSLLKKSNA